MHLSQLKTEGLASLQSCEAVAERMRTQASSSSGVAVQRNTKNFDVLGKQLEHLRSKHKADLMTVLDTIEQADTLAKTLSLFDARHAADKRKTESLKGEFGCLREELALKYTAITSLIERSRGKS
jgi:hypothetical protein